MGTSLGPILSVMYLGRSRGRPAPEKMMSTFSRTAVATTSLKLVRAHMMFTPRMPLVISRALRICSARARELASMKLVL